MAEQSQPTRAERFFFDNNGYLVLERLLTEVHVAGLRQALDHAIARRQSLQERGIPHTGMTQVQGANTRIFYILDDDPSFLELIDWPPIWPYVTGLLNERPHHHASDVIVEYGPKGRRMGWHQDGHDNAYRGLGSPIPLLQLKVGYYLTDMTEGGRGNLCVIPGSHNSHLHPSSTRSRHESVASGTLPRCE